MPPPTPLIPTQTLTLSLPVDIALSEPTSLPLNLPIILDKRQTYVTVSVMKNSTSDDSSTEKKSSGFPVAIAIPALVGGMALALAGFGIWYWWNRKVKRERRAAWEARERKKRKRAEQSARPSVSSSTRTPNSGGQKSPINEKGFIPPVPTLPKNAATQDPYKERGYGYSGQPQQQQPPQHIQQNTAGAFGYVTQPGYEQDLGYNHSYDEYGQPIVQPQHQQQQQQQYYNDTTNNDNSNQNYGHSRGKSTDSSNPSNPFSNSNSEVPSSTKAEEIPTLAAPVKTEKSSKRALARMNIADSAAANQNVDPAYRHQPKKPSPLALAAAEKKAAEARANQNHNQMEHLAPPGNESSLPPYDSGNGNAPGINRANSGEWGVALGSPNNDGQFDFNRQDYQNEHENNDPYLQQQEQRGKSGMYTQDPYASYHGNNNEEEDGDVYHRAAEGMGLGSGNNTAKKSRWV